MKIGKGHFGYQFVLNCVRKNSRLISEVIMSGISWGIMDVNISAYRPHLQDYLQNHRRISQTGNGHLLHLSLDYFLLLPPESRVPNIDCCVLYITQI